MVISQSIAKLKEQQALLKQKIEKLEHEQFIKLGKLTKKFVQDKFSDFAAFKTEVGKIISE